jgi:hypothetical protein
MYVEVGSFARPVFLTGGGCGTPPDVWKTFEDGENSILGYIRSSLSKNIHTAFILTMYMVWPDLNRKFAYQYTASAKNVEDTTILSIKRSPALELDSDGHQTGNYKCGTKEEVWTESLKKNTEPPKFFGG